MWTIKSIGIIFFLKIAFVSIRGADDAADSSTYNVDSMVNKEYKVIFEKGSWYTANKFCAHSGMQLASVSSFVEQQLIEELIRDKYMVDQPFWISKSTVAVESISDWQTTITENLRKMPRRTSSNQCISWLWLNVDYCFALWPLANEWNHAACSEKKYFICELTYQRETEMLKVIEDELFTLVDDTMFTGFAQALSTTTEGTWISLVTGALQTWSIEQQKIPKPSSLLDEQVTLLAAELSRMEKPFESDELRKYVNQKYNQIEHDDRVPFLSERFRQFIGEEYIKLEGGTNQNPSDEIISLLVEKVLMLAKVQEINLAKEELAKISEATAGTDVLDEAQLNVISQQLLKFTENEFESYVMDVMSQLETLGVEEVDMNMLLQLYLLVKQELFLLIATTAMKATSKERHEITSYGLTRILEGKQLIEEESVFGQIFVLMGTGTAVLSEEKSVNSLDDVLLREFVKNEFDGLKHEDILKLKYEGYIKFIIDEVIKLPSDINLAKNDSDELLLSKVIDLIATQLLLYAEDEMKIIAERLTKSIEEKSNKLQKIVKQTLNNDGDKSQKLLHLIERELFTITVNSLVHFTEKEMIKLSEEGLTKILTGDHYKSIEKPSIFEKVLVALGDEIEGLQYEQLERLVKREFEKTNYKDNIELVQEMCMKLIADEFIELVAQGAVMLSPHEEEKHQFGEMVRLLARHLLDIAESSFNVDNSKSSND